GPVVLDRTAGALVLPGGRVVDMADAASARLQQPSGAADAVVVATPQGLVTQPLSGGDATTRRASGTPAAPVQLGGCTYGAWSGTGQVVRDCPGTDRDVDQTLEGADGELAYRVNRQAIVLNDVADGTLWMAADDFEKVDDWDLTMPEEAEGEKVESETTTPEMVDQFLAERDKPNRPPEPKDDVMGVRPGRTTVLDVLANDVDPDGDVMTVTVRSDDFEKVDDWDLTMPEEAEGEKVESETTTPEMVDQFLAERDKPNRPPEPKDDVMGVRPGRTTVLDVLANDVDPDGDVMTVTVEGPDVDTGITVDRVLDGAALQADVSPTASGST